MSHRDRVRASIILACVSGAAIAHDAAQPAADTVITPLIEHALAQRNTAVASMLTVEYAPGASTPPHTHPADTFVYVLDGAIEMQVEGGALTLLKAGQTYYESPADTHVVSRNASRTAPAKFLVVMIKEPTAPVLVPVDAQ